MEVAHEARLDDQGARDRGELFESDRREVVFDVLQEVPTPVDLQTLARSIAEREHGIVAEDEAERIAISLHLFHLPTMDEAGLIRYDARAESIALWPPVDTRHDLLSSQRRRHVLDILRGAGTMALPELAEAVVAREAGQHGENISAEKALEVYMSLWHAHIPKLEENEVVTYNQGLDTVELTENVDRFPTF